MFIEARLDMVSETRALTLARSKSAAIYSCGMAGARSVNRPRLHTNAERQQRKRLLHHWRGLAGSPLLEMARRRCSRRS